MISVELQHDDAAFLREQLGIRLREVENELIHTEKRSMQADIARDLERLQRLHDHVARVLGGAESNVAE